MSSVVEQKTVPQICVREKSFELAAVCARYAHLVGKTFRDPGRLDIPPALHNREEIAAALPTHGPILAFFRRLELIGSIILLSAQLPSGAKIMLELHNVFPFFDIQLHQPSDEDRVLQWLKQSEFVPKKWRPRQDSESHIVMVKKREGLKLPSYQSDKKTEVYRVFLRDKKVWDHVRRTLTTEKDYIALCKLYGEEDKFSVNIMFQYQTGLQYNTHFEFPAEHVTWVSPNAPDCYAGHADVSSWKEDAPDPDRDDDEVDVKDFAKARRAREQAQAKKAMRRKTSAIMEGSIDARHLRPRSDITDKYGLSPIVIAVYDIETASARAMGAHLKQGKLPPPIDGFVYDNAEKKRFPDISEFANVQAEPSFITGANLRTKKAKTSDKKSSARAESFPIDMIKGPMAEVFTRARSRQTTLEKGRSKNDLLTKRKYTEERDKKVTCVEQSRTEGEFVASPLFGDPNRTEDPICMIGCEFWIQGDSQPFLSTIHSLLDADRKTTPGMEDTVQYEWSGCGADDEKNMLNHFAHMMRTQMDVDILGGWNSNGFDTPLLMIRAEKLHASRMLHMGRLLQWPDDKGTFMDHIVGHRFLGRNGKPVFRNVECTEYTFPGVKVHIPGVEQLDFMIAAKNLGLKMDSYSLSEVAKVYLKGLPQKIGLPHKLISPYFATNLHTRAQLRKYLRWDVMVTSTAMNTLQLFLNTILRSTLTRTSMHDLFGGTQIQTWNQLQYDIYQYQWILDEATRIVSQKHFGVETAGIKQLLIDQPVTVAGEGIDLKKGADTWVVRTVHGATDIVNTATGSVFKEYLRSSEEKNAERERKSLMTKAQLKAERAGYTGGLVLHPLPGFYGSSCFTLDFGSLYPTVMSAHMLDPATHIHHLYDAKGRISFPSLHDSKLDILLWRMEDPEPTPEEQRGKIVILVVEEWSTELMREQAFNRILTLLDTGRLKPHYCPRATGKESVTIDFRPLIENFRMPMLKKPKDWVRPTGILPKSTMCFVWRVDGKIPPTLVINTLTKLLNKRAEIKTQMKTAEEAKEYVRAKVLKSRQLQVKLNANALYGFLGATTGMMGFLAIAAATTILGQFHAHLANLIAEHLFFLRSIYGDTDSIMCQGLSLERHYGSVEAAKGPLSQWVILCGRTISDAIPSPMTIVPENGAHMMLWAPKMYAKLKFWPPEEAGLTTKGLSIVRSDTCELVRVLHKVAISDAMGLMSKQWTKVDNSVDVNTFIMDNYVLPLEVVRDFYLDSDWTTLQRKVTESKADVWVFQVRGDHRTVLCEDLKRATCLSGFVLQCLLDYLGPIEQTALPIIDSQPIKTLCLPNELLVWNARNLCAPMFQMEEKLRLQQPNRDDKPAERKLKFKTLTRLRTSIVQSWTKSEQYVYQGVQRDLMRAYEQAVEAWLLNPKKLKYEHIQRTCAKAENYANTGLAQVVAIQESEKKRGSPYDVGQRIAFGFIMAPQNEVKTTKKGRTMAVKQIKMGRYAMEINDARDARIPINRIYYLEQMTKKFKAAMQFFVDGDRINRKAEEYHLTIMNEEKRQPSINAMFQMQMNKAKATRKVEMDAELRRAQEEVEEQSRERFELGIEEQYRRERKPDDEPDPDDENDEPDIVSLGGNGGDGYGDGDGDGDGGEGGDGGWEGDVIEQNNYADQF